MTLTYLQLSGIADVPLEQDDGADSIFADQTLDLWAGRETMEADSKELTPIESAYATFSLDMCFSFYLSDFPTQDGRWHLT